jgi:hypothetical protein
LSADVLGEFMRSHRAYLKVENELRDIEVRFEAAISARQTTFLEVARLDVCPTCFASSSYPCLFPTEDLTHRKVPDNNRVHAARDRRARDRLKALGVFP